MAELRHKPKMGNVHCSRFIIFVRGARDNLVRSDPKARVDDLSAMKSDLEFCTDLHIYVI